MCKSENSESYTTEIVGPDGDGESSNRTIVPGGGVKSPAEITTIKSLLKLVSKDPPGHRCVVVLDEDGNVSLREEDTGHEVVRFLPETLDKIHAAVHKVI